MSSDRETQTNSPEQQALASLTPSAESRLLQFTAFLQEEIAHEWLRGKKYNFLPPADFGDIDAAIKRVSVNPRKMHAVKFSLAALSSILIPSIVGIFVTLAAKLPFSTVLYFVSAGGITLAIACVISSYLDLRSSLKRRRARELLYYERGFLARMQDFEEAATALVSKTFPEEPESATLRTTLELLERFDSWSDDDTREFRKLLSYRNNFVHLHISAMSIEDFTSAYSTLDRLTEKIKEASRQAPTRSQRPQVKWEKYQNEVLSAIHRVSGVENVHSDYPIGDSSFDFMIERDTSLILIEVKYRHKGNLASDAVLEIITKLPDLNCGILVITNSGLSQEIRRLNASTSDAMPRVEVIQWASNRDDDLLGRALGRLFAATSATVRSQPRVELYMDRGGRFRFRIKAKNGEVIVTSEAYNSKDSAIRAIDQLRELHDTDTVRDTTGM